MATELAGETRPGWVCPDCPDCPALWVVGGLVPLTLACAELLQGGSLVLLGPLCGAAELGGPCLRHPCVQPHEIAFSGSSGEYW